MKKKNILKIVIICLIVGVLAIMGWYVLRQNKSFLPMIFNRDCTYILPSNNNVVLNKCIKDKKNLEIGKLVVYDQYNSQISGRIIEKMELVTGIHYRVSNETTEIIIPAESIIATE